MNFLLQFTLLFALGLVFLGHEVRGDECTSTLSDLTKRQLNGVQACTKAMKFKNGKDKAKKMTCILKCVLKKEGFLLDNGQMTQAQFEEFMKKNAPESLHAKFNTTFAPCIKEDPLDDADEFCKDYEPMIKCLFGTLPNMCK